MAIYAISTATKIIPIILTTLFQWLDISVLLSWIDDEVEDHGQLQLFYRRA